jgi:hypothetical protein
MLSPRPTGPAGAPLRGPQQVRDDVARFHTFILSSIMGGPVRS